MRMTAVIDPAGTLELDLGGEKTTAPYPSVMDARRSVMSTATDLAAETRTATELHIEDPSGSRTILVQTDGAIVEQPAESEPTESGPVQPAEAVEPAPASPVTPEEPTVPEATAEAPELVATPVPVPVPAPAPAPAPAPVEAPVATEARAPETVASSAVAPAVVPVETVEPLPTRRTAMPSFVDRPDADSPAQVGVRGLLNQFGLKFAASPAELEQRRDEKTVSQHWAGPRTITVLNPKGGAGKTPTVICLSAVFARLGGSGVLAWDNNNSLGSLGWRTFDAGHEATVVDLLEQTDYFMTAGARAGDLASYVHHQPSDQYDVLRSDDRSGAKKRHEVTGDEVHRLYSVAAKYYRLILMDSGNTERGDNWEAMIGHSDQVVIPVKSVDDAAEGASRVLSALRAGNEHAQSLADRAVVIVLGCTPSHGPAKLNELAESFRPFVKSVVTVPYDPSLIEGRIRFSSMLPQTRRAWLRAAAQIAEGL
ncbi:MinD-like ATPase involved in chromosome partitioning or flagellar assembly [Arthrobacter sp. CAN_A6]|uniref:MinD/ParA family ATP-binding protein n=1 Tax=Arthrobacter sp. CAN_A6 TaxID=2787721 RepID=UPI0018CB2CB8